MDASSQRDAGARAEWEERIGKRSATGAVSQGQHTPVALLPPDGHQAIRGRPGDIGLAASRRPVGADDED